MTAISDTPSLLAPDNYSVRDAQWRAPTVAADETILFDEPGRVLDRRSSQIASRGVDCRSHYFRVTLPRFGQYTLRVKHGGGEESCSLSYDSRVIDGLAQMDSDNRFRLLWIIMDVQHNAATKAAERVNSTWRRAAAEKRIKTRKLPKQSGVKVWIADAAPLSSTP